eukprot:scaffold189307_cov31-Tisochrysis_lutea.AAC.3
MRHAFPEALLEDTLTFSSGEMRYARTIAVADRDAQQSRSLALIWASWKGVNRFTRKEESLDRRFLRDKLGEMEHGA